MPPWRGILVLVGGFVLHLTLGSGYTAGNMSTYIISYIHNLGDNPDIKNSDAVWIFTMVKFGQGLLMSVGGILDGKIGGRATSYIGGTIASIGVALTYFTVETSLTFVVLTYGLMFGLGISIAYISPMAAAMKWFPEHKGLVNGIIVGGFGMGSFIFTQVQTFYLNPKNSAANKQGYFTDVDLLQRIPKVFLLLSAIYSTMQLFACATLCTPETQKKKDKSVKIPEGKTNLAYTPNDTGDELAINSGEITQEKQNEKPIKRNYTTKEMLKCSQFYILWLTFCFNQPIIVYIPSMYKAYGQTFIEDDKFMAIVGAVSAIFNSFGRVIWGWVLDKTNYKICMLVLTIGVAVFTATLGLTPYGGKPMFAIWVWMIYLFVSGNFTLMPTCTTNTFGIKHAAVNYGLVFSNTLISAPVAAILTQTLSSVIGWYGMFGLMAAFSFISMILTFFFKEIQS